MKKVIGLAILALTISACDDSDSSSSDATPSPSPTPDTTPAPTTSPDPSASPTATPTPTPDPDYGEKGACLVPVDTDATTSVATGMGCVACGVSEPDAVVTASLEDVATMSATLSLFPVGGESDVALEVALGKTLDPTMVLSEEVTDEQGVVTQEAVPAPNSPGFVVSFPDPSILSAGVLPELLIETLSGGEVLESSSYGFGFGDGFALGTLLLDINNAEVYLPVTATQSYDAIRLSLTGTVLNTLLDVDVHAACVNGVGGSISGDF